jgi:hypothetical protein
MQDIYFIIAEHCDFETLMTLKDVSKLFNFLSFCERKRRLKSKYPFGEKEAKIKIALNDIGVEKVICVLPRGLEIYIPPNKYAMYYVADVLTTWFFYNIPFNQWILTSKVIKSMIRLANKSETKDMGDTLTFDFKEEKSFLLEI